MRFIKKYADETTEQAALDNKELGKPYVVFIEDGQYIDWNGKEPDYSNMYFTIEALSGGTFYVRKANFGYSVNGADWETTTGETALSLNQGDAVRFKGKITGSSALFSGNTLAFDAYGNIESLEYDDDFSGVTTIRNISGFSSCFRDCTGFNDASNLILPATSLKKDSYQYMFRGCTNLINPPKILPATTIPIMGYYAMFSRCESLVSAPIINATNFGNIQTCIYMFNGCASLTKAPDLLTETLTNACYQEMFSGCTSLNYVKCLAGNPNSQATSGNVYNWLLGVSPTGTFVKKAGVTWPTGDSGIPSGWTVIEE